MGLERNSLFIPVVDGRGNSVHGHDSSHEGGGDASGEISNKDILVSDACKGRVVLKVRNVLDEGWGVSVVLPFGHVFGGEPGNSVASGVMVFARSFKFGDEIQEGSHSYGGSGDGILPECGRPSEGGTLGHVGQSEGNLFVVIVVDLFIDEEVESYGIQPLSEFVIGSINGFRCSNVEFGGFRGGHW